MPKSKVLLILILVTVFIVTLSQAQENGGIYSEQFSRILASPNVSDITTDIEKIYDLKCVLPKEEDIKWTCLKSSTCLYRLPVNCESKKAAKFEILITGFDNGKTNEIKSVKITGPH